ncbi:type II secretion system protein E (GspE) [Desulfocurvibacter africanus PCS]|uniref:protein-secreting ATPase n=1 Tax=Desulfocurvibacter africanus PCS TaxID=1262666 RepID=M5Q3B4_DESAF|nr:type II secretion system ATPase GspE [Desulfocurvibacter africanus]EMG38153.1 type II secretion system protein E (GspE) [Desulfocurvibacter africanus PCS]
MSVTLREQMGRVRAMLNPADSSDAKLSGEVRSGQVRLDNDAPFQAYPPPSLGKPDSGGREPSPEELALELGLRFVPRVEEGWLDLSLVRGLPIAYLKQNLVLPVKGESGCLLVLVGDPLRVEVMDELRLILTDGGADGRPKAELNFAMAPAEVILEAINQTFAQADSRADQIIQDLGVEEDDDRLLSELERGGSEDLLDETSNAPVIKLVNHILAQAVKSRASDIHVEPFKNELLVRFRLDGVLHNILHLPKRLQAPVASRIKIMAKLNIAEKRLPQDGRIEVRIGNRQVDLRVSSLPTAFGERVVMRLLEKNARLLSLEELGMGPDHHAEMRRLTQLSHGIILVTGPTGSGKTTTLYAALSSINSPDKNILTIEDPIEYQLDGIGQMQVNTKIDLTFAKGLRSMVRQDPDVILVGEIRDRETAEIAIQASLTGHLVFSTLHTNDAPSAVTRLIDIGIEPFLVSSAVRTIIAQRLVRVLCPACKREDTPTAKELREMGLCEDAAPVVHRAVGCSECMQTGYRGRTSIYEFMRLTESLQDLVVRNSDANQIRKLALSEGMCTLRQDGIRRVLNGVTTLDEVMRVTLL